MIAALGLLLGCQLLGEMLVRGMGLPIPGPVVGLLLLATGLGLATRAGRIRPDDIDDSAVGRVAAALLGSLGLLFVPAGAGVVEHLDLLAAHGVALVTALVGSTLITLIVAVAVFRLLARGRAP